MAKQEVEQKKRGPVIQPTEFSGSGDWNTWLRKFQRLAELYAWETSEKLKWLEAKLSGQAARAFEVIDKDTSIVLLKFSRDDLNRNQDSCCIRKNVLRTREKEAKTGLRLLRTSKNLLLVPILVPMA